MRRRPVGRWAIFTHFMFWIVPFNAVLLVLADHQRTHWCELPDWAAPEDLWPGYCDATPHKIVVRSL